MNTHTQQPVRLHDAPKDAMLAFMGNTQTTNYKLQISTNALDDHMDRLYDEWSSTEIDPNAAPHVDGPHMGVITIIKRNARTTTVEMTHMAVREFVSDMEYQVECCEDDFQRAYRNQCRRALASVRKQMAKEVGQ